MGMDRSRGILFLREAIQDYYRSFGVAVDAEDIFISDGAKSDVGNILDLFDQDNTVLIPDPVYPFIRIPTVWRDVPSFTWMPIRETAFAAARPAPKG